MGPNSVHNLALKEIVIKGEDGKWNHAYCFKDGTKDWNTALDGGTPAIHLVQGATPAASIDYTLSANRVNTLRSYRNLRVCIKLCTR
jgi:hypothetical protein